MWSNAVFCNQDGLSLQAILALLQIILVGDTNQLPPTVLSQVPGAAALAQSLFARMQATKCPVALLQHQYRMHPAISYFPRQHFYEGQLLDGIPASSAAFHRVRTCAENMHEVSAGCEP